MRVSERLKFELLRRRATGQRQYSIANAAHLHPSVVSALVNNALPLSKNDPRVARLAKVLGLSIDECLDAE
jgi:hypothetical protein